MNVIRVELISENNGVATYKVTFEEEYIYHTKLLYRTFNYDADEIEDIPESVLDFVEKWILAGR